MDEVVALRRQVAELQAVIAAHEQMEEALRESEERYRSLFENAYDGIVCFTEEGTITSVNRGFEAMTGRTRVETTGHHYSTLLTSECAERMAERTRRIQAGERLPSIYEIEVVHQTGHVIPIEARTRLIRTAADKPLGVLAIMRDITGRKRAEEALRQAEEKYRSIFENAIEGIFQTIPSGAILSANPALARMLGYDSLEELKAQVTNVGAQLYADPQRRAEVLEMLKEQGTAHDVESQLYRKDGSTFWASVSVRAVGNADGAILYYEGSVEDITKRRAAEQLKNEFVSMVSHELRTPLTSIRGALGLLASGMLGPLPEKGQRMLDIAVRNTDRLVRLINDILDVERIQSGKVSMDKTICSMADLMTQASEAMQAMAEKAEVTLAVQPLQVDLWVDPDRILQTLTNLLSNAIKFSPAGTTVWLTADWWGEHLLVQIKDQGRGIPADKLESIFERFQQVDVADSRDKGGTGLGLAICRSIVHQHGGRIWAESTLREGSTFSFTLPLSKEGRPTNSLSSVGALINSGSEPSHRKVAKDEQMRRLQVLVAEEDRDLARVLIALFERHGAIVYYAQTGTEAIQCYDFVVPDLLVLDPIMPEQDGFVVVDWMRQHEQLCQIPVVVYGVEELTAVEQQRLTLGPTLFFTKSRIPPEQFEQQVMQWLSRITPMGEEVIREARII
jgi:PAS domain S-box-containing protein